MSENNPLSTADRIVDAPKEQPGPPKSDRNPYEGLTVEPGRQNVTGDGLPQNLQNKDVDQIAEDYRKLQAERGRQANEIGELRRQLAEVQAAKKDVHAEPDPDYWEDPARAVDAKLQPIQRKMAELEADKTRAELRSTHPDYEQTFQDAGFREWMQERRSRVLLAMSADAGDVDAARELLDTYREAAATGDATPREAVRRDRVARASATERGSGRRPSGQVWSRMELQNMRAFNPTRYQELLPEIKRAYAEGRVRD